MMCLYLDEEPALCVGDARFSEMFSAHVIIASSVVVNYYFIARNFNEKIYLNKLLMLSAKRCNNKYSQTLLKSKDD